MSDLFEATCTLCSVPIELHPQKEWEIAWRLNCADSLYLLIDFESLVFRQLLDQAVYCCQCEQLVRDIDFMMRSVRCFQRRISTAKAKVSSFLVSKLSSNLASFNAHDYPNQQIEDICFLTSFEGEDIKPYIGDLPVFGDTEDIPSTIHSHNFETRDTNTSHCITDLEDFSLNQDMKMYRCLECNVKFLFKSKLMRHFATKKHAKRAANSMLNKSVIHGFTTNTYSEDNSTASGSIAEEIATPMFGMLTRTRVKNLSLNEDSLTSEPEDEDADYHPELFNPILEYQSNEESEEIKEKSFDSEVNKGNPDSKDIFKETVDFLLQLEPFAQDSKYHEESMNDQEESTLGSAFQCPFCENKYYSNGYSLDQHIIGEHEGDKLCLICSVETCRMRFYGLDCSNALKSHMALVHSVENYDHKKSFIHMDYLVFNTGSPVSKKRKCRVTQNFFCPVEGCLAQDMSEESLKFHRKEVHEKQQFPYNCKDCDYRGKTRQAYDNHRSVRHSFKRIQCKLCSYTTLRLKNYHHHMKHCHRNQKLR